MDFFEVIKKRHCCRNFHSNKIVSDNLISKIISAGKSAPSAGGIYPINFTIIKNLKTKEKISQASLGQDFLIDASVVLVIWADLEKAGSKYGERGRKLYVIQDGAAAAENIFLAATALGLGCCWIGAFDEEKISKILELKPNIRPMVIMPIGYKK